MNDAEEQSLDLVQRLIASALVVIVVGAPTIALAGYAVLAENALTGTRIGLCVLSAVMGLVAGVVINLFNRRHWYLPTILIGLIPAAIAAYLIFRI